MNRLKTFWEHINQPLLNPDRRNVDHGALWRLYRSYFIRPHLKRLLITVFFGFLVGQPIWYFFSACGRYIADDIVQVELQAKERAKSTSVDVSWPDENRTFQPDAQVALRSSWSQQHDQAVGLTVPEKLRRLRNLALLICAVVLLRYFAHKAMQNAGIIVSQDVKYRLRQTLYNKLHALPMRYHDTQSTGKMMTNLFSDVEVIHNQPMMLTFAIPMNIATMVIGLVILLGIDVKLSLLVLLALPAYALTYRFFHKRLRTVNTNLRERQGWLNGYINNRVRNFYLVKSFVRERFEGIDFLRRNRPIIQDAITNSLLGALFTAACGVISGVCMVAVLWLGALRVRDGQMTLGTLLLFYASAGLMFSPVAQLATHITTLHCLAAVAHKIVRVLDEPISIANAENPIALPDQPPSLEFRNVTMHYDANRDPALKDISFSIPAGHTLCVMGPSGAGKSTLARLACRIYDPTGGEIFLDGLDIRSYRLGDLRDKLGYVHQEPIIFDGTIRQNISYGSEQAPPQQMVSAARNAQIHDFIQRLPERYDTITAERGLTLSGGQKQRVNLARVLLYEPLLLVLDDCTSALDAETEVKLINRFEQALARRTAILVTHRISIAMKCDTVLILEEGRIAEHGRPADLLASGGTFRAMHELQNEKPSTPAAQPTS
jgi:ATP-binding cassette, subfamily B, putative efflux pump